MSAFEHLPSPTFAQVGRQSDLALTVMHVPKAAGTSVTAAIAEALSGDVDNGGFDRSLFGQFCDYDGIDPNFSRHIRHNATDMPQRKVVMGHYALTTLRAAYPQAQRVTFLREPITRILSFWVYWRSLGDDQLAMWGNWRDYIAISRSSLKVFLTDKRVACQTDNLVTRMLLWPNELIPGGDFIEDKHDFEILEQARRQLKLFDYVNVVENGSFDQHLSDWMGAAIKPLHLNETPRVPESLRLRLDHELDDATLAILTHRSRLDVRLWSSVAQAHMPAGDVDGLRQRAATRGVARYGALLAP